MRAQVRLLSKNGRVMNRDELKDIPPFVGLLKVGEIRDPKLGRALVRARLLDPTKNVEEDLIPELDDAQLLWAEDRKMRLSGTERLKDSNVYQTWSVEFD